MQFVPRGKAIAQNELHALDSRAQSLECISSSRPVPLFDRLDNEAHPLLFSKLQAA